MKKYIVILIAVAVSFVSCKHETITKGRDPHVYPIYKNSYRVKTITGKNEAWGEFKLLVNYKNENLNVSYRTNNLGDTVGSISFGTSSAIRQQVYKVYDYVVNISQDSIQRLDLALKAKYGEGNYSLKDTINNRSRSSQLRFQVTNTYYPDGRVSKSELLYSKPQENVSTTDEGFNIQYSQVKKVFNQYEYNDDGRIVANRIMEDTYPDPTDLEVYNRRKYKQEIAYDGEKVLEFKCLELIAGENFSEIENFVYNYDGNRIISVNSQTTKRTFHYNGETISEIVIGSEKYSYTFDSNNRVSKITDPKGNYMIIEYEDGHGDFSELTPLMEKHLGHPYIK